MIDRTARANRIGLTLVGLLLTLAGAAALTILSLCWLNSATTSPARKVSLPAISAGRISRIASFSWASLTFGTMKNASPSCTNRASATMVTRASTRA
jgi:hypothetical protein